MRSAGLLSERRAVPLAASWGAVAVLALMAFYFLSPDARLDFSEFDTRDGESYVALSRALFSGLGYTRNLDPHYYLPHTTWPPGMPLLLLPAVALAGLPVDMLVLKLGMIAYGAAGILLAYLYARRLSADPLVQTAVPLLLGLDPFYWHFSRMTLSEMPTTVWAILTLLLVDIAWRRARIRSGAAFAIGLVAGFGMLIRGSFYGALLLPLVPLAQRRELRTPWRNGFLPYALGFLLPFAAWSLRNSLIDRSLLGQDGIDQLSMILRSAPVDPSSPLRSVAEIVADIRLNLAAAAVELPKAIIPGLWPLHLPPWLASALGLGLVALAGADGRCRPLVLMAGTMAALNLFYAVGAMPRLWVPVSALVAIALPLGAERLGLFRRRAGTWLSAILGTALAVNLGVYILHHRAHPYRDQTYAALAEMFETVRAEYPLQGSVLTPDPQAFSLITGLSAPMAVPRLGIDPPYAYIILPADNVTPRLGATILATNETWSLVALKEPLKLAAIRERLDCRHRLVAAFAVIANCPIW